MLKGMQSIVIFENFGHCEQLIKFFFVTFIENNLIIVGVVKVLWTFVVDGA